jgi:tripartite-type tricarboxylate transporter receptor subunit TctC
LSDARLFIRGAIFFLAFASWSPLWAQNQFPAGPITIVVPFSAGGSADAVVRLFADTVERHSGKRFIVENRGGGGGVVAAMTVKAARSDGYTLRLADIGPDAVLPNMQRTDYDSLKDFRPITQLFSWPQFLIVPSSSPANSVAELVKLAASKPEGLSQGSQGVGSGGYLLGAMFRLATGAKIVDVPYKGGGPLAVDLATGRLDLVFGAYREARSAIEAGKEKVLAVASSHRSSVLPHVPTMAEAGYPGLELAPWFGLVAPAGTPDAVINYIHDVFAEAAADPALQKRLGDDAVEIKISKPKEFAAFIADERERLGKIVREAGIQGD